MMASYHGHSEVVKLLHEYGARVDLEDKDGSSALTLAKQKRHSKVIEILHSEKINTKSNTVVKPHPHANKVSPYARK